MARPPIHGYWNHKLYNTWQNMMERCYNSKCKFYYNYGARGINVYEPWKNVSNFIPEILSLLGERPKGFSIDRIDNEKGYYPNNVKWSSLTQQANNRRSVKIYSYKGQSKSLKEWTKELKLNHKTIWSRLNKGWDFEKAITYPIDIGNGGRIRSRLRNSV